MAMQMYLAENEGQFPRRDDTAIMWWWERLFLDYSIRRVELKELWMLKWSKQSNTAGPWTKAGGVRPEDWPPWMRGFKDY